MRKKLGVLFGTFVLLVAVAAGAWAVQYRMVDLWPISNDCSAAYGINDNGQVVGYFRAANCKPISSSYAFLWQNGVRKCLSHPYVDWGIAYSINNSGQIAGVHYDLYCNPHAALWENGTIQDICYGYAKSINDNGQVVGYSSNSFAFTWQNGTLQDLGTLSQHGSYAYSINNSGQIVGESWATDFPPHIRAILWQNGTMHSLGSCDGEAYGINDNGQIVGLAADANYNSFAFLWQNGVMQNLVPGFANAINNSGQVVGQSSNRHAFLWQNGTMQDLGTLGGNSSCAYDINSKGQIVGESIGKDGLEHAVLWDPIITPEPSSLLALVSGLGAFGILARRRRK